MTNHTAGGWGFVWFVFTAKKENKFTYTYIDENDKKVTKSLSIEDSDFVMKRMTELAKQVADSNMEL